MKNFALTLTAEPIFGRALTLTECSASLAKMSLGAVVARLTLFKRLNEEILCSSTAPVADRRAHTLRTLHTLLDGEGVRKALNDINNDQTFRPLSDQALFAAIELALCCCPRDTDHWIDGDPLRLELTHVLLSFQSSLFSPALHNLADTETSFEGLGESGQAEFIRNTLAHKTELYSRHAIGRLYAFCHEQAVADIVITRTNRSVTDWFVETFGLTPDDFLCCAFLSAGLLQKFDLADPNPDTLAFNEETYWNVVQEPERTKVRKLVALATQKAGEVRGTPDGELNQFLYRADGFHIRPVIDLGQISICVSRNLLLRKFLFGLPYLAQEARQNAVGRSLTKNEIKHCRAMVGVLFESYVGWLVRSLLGAAHNIEILTNVTYGTKANRREIDVLVIRGDLALILEVKASVASLGFRRTGRFEDLDAMIEVGATQAYQGAHALRGGLVKRANGDPIEGIRWVVPCVVTYDDVPLFEPISFFYEQHLAGKTGLPLFTGADGVEPVQFYDIDFIESWEEEFDLSHGSGAIFGYLIQRARDATLRYRQVRSGIVAKPPTGASKPFNALVEESRVFIEKKTRSWLSNDRLQKRSG